MKKVDYAPIIIPTLNRYEHFKKCFESLSKCTGADKTEVFIGLDYPAQEKHYDGWKKIDNFLRGKENNNTFLKLHVIRREFNYGIKGNFRSLQSIMHDNYDQYIVSEDDNVFSPNFLEYINQGLNKYKTDNRVFCICGYSQPYPFVDGNSNTFFHRTDMSAWGFGIWTNKEKKFEEFVKNDCFRKKMSLKNLMKVKKHGFNRLYQYITYSFRRRNEPYDFTDCAMTCYVILNDLVVLNPMLSKVRNIGWDMSGASFANNPKLLKKYGDIPQKHKDQRIDRSVNFEFVGNPLDVLEENDRIASKFSEAKMKWYVFVKRIVFFFIKRTFK